MRALVERTDSFGDRYKFWIVGHDKNDCWDQMYALQSQAIGRGTKDYYNIIVWCEYGIYRDAYTGQIITNSENIWD